MAVYPTFERFDITPLNRLRARPLREPRFVLDVHLGKLARYVRMLGFDALQRNDYEDQTIIDLAAEQRRTGIDDENHFAYSTFARAATQRRENLKTSVADLKSQLDTAAAALDLAEAELAHEQDRHSRETGDILGLSDERTADSAI